MTLLLDGTHQARPLVQTPFDERNGILFPDGQRFLVLKAHGNDSNGVLPQIVASSTSTRS